MSNRHTTLASLFTDIANAIRTKKGEASSVTYLADDFDTAIAALPSNGIEDISTAAAMAALLNNPANINKIYRYTGTTTTDYVNGRLYLVERLPDYLCITANEADVTVYIQQYGTTTLNLNFSCSTDKIAWTDFTSTASTLKTYNLQNVGDKLYIKGNNPNGVCESDTVYCCFRANKRISASGSIMSLIDGLGYTTVIPNNYCFSRFFLNCSVLITPPDLPATTLKPYCYNALFNSCEELTTAPALPATTLADFCYYGMFLSCISLTSASALPATNLAQYAYAYMFGNCTALTTIPALPATTITSNCYYGMFYNCSALILSDNSGEGYAHELRIPTTGTLNDNCTIYVFAQGCATGSGRQTDMLFINSGSSQSLFTQNTPV